PSGNSRALGLAAATTGVLLDTKARTLAWTTSEAQGPSTNLITVRVTDSGAPPLSATNSFTVVVREVNSAPVLTVPADQTINELKVGRATCREREGDLPDNEMCCDLVGAATGDL